MNTLTDRQLVHRDYLRSPLWAKKRAEALAHYGAICFRCGSFGSDVHHKTYERVGGNELLDDLEILCRPCHEAHHRSERAVVSQRARPKRKPISVTALTRYLTPRQRTLLAEKYYLRWPEIYTAIVTMKRRDIIRDALEMLGFDRAYVHTKRRRP